jgi:hypothetical protein
MNNKILLLLITSFLAGSIYFGLTPTSSCDEPLYNKFVTIEGQVTTDEIESGKVLIDTGKDIIFQRVDCKRCLFMAQSDKNGRYQILVGEGKYKIIVNNCGKSRTESCLSPNQPEIIDAINRVSHNIFDIKLVHHKEDIPYITVVE